MLSSDVHAKLLDCLRGTAERCGLLFGECSASRWTIRSFEELENLADANDRFELDSLEVVARARAQRALGLECLGAWHTHPRRPALLSESDRLGASEGWLSLVIAGDGGAAMRAFEHGRGLEAHELQLVIKPSGADCR